MQCFGRMSIVVENYLSIPMKNINRNLDKIANKKV